MTDHPAASSPPRARIYRELLVVLLITFGMSGVRSLLRLIDAALSSTPLNQQTATLNASQADSPWLDLALQLCSAAVLCGWGLLVLYLLNPDKVALPKPRLGNLGSGAGLAALIGLPGLLFYLGALQLGFTKNVVPSTLDAWWEAPVLLVWSFANAFAEETVVVLWLGRRWLCRPSCGEAITCTKASAQEWATSSWGWCLPGFTSALTKYGRWSSRISSLMRWRSSAMPPSASLSWDF